MSKQQTRYRVFLISNAEKSIVSDVKLVEVEAESGFLHLELKGKQWLLIKSKGFFSNLDDQLEIKIKRKDNSASYIDAPIEYKVVQYVTIKALPKHQFYHIDQVDDGIRITHNDDFFPGLHLELNSIKIERI